MTTPHPPPPPQQWQYIAIGRCSKLSAPAIFCSWNDCREYVEVGNHGNNTQGRLYYQTFGSMPEAVKYVEWFTANYSATSASNDTVQNNEYASKNNTPTTASSKPSAASGEAGAPGHKPPSQQATRTASNANQSNQNTTAQVTSSSSTTEAPAASSATTAAATNGNHASWQYPTGTPGYPYPTGASPYATGSTPYPTTPYPYAPWPYPSSYYPTAQAPAAATATNAAPAPVTPAKSAPSSAPTTPSQVPPRQAAVDSTSAANKTSSEIDAAAKTPDQTTSGGQPAPTVTPSTVTAAPTDATTAPTVAATTAFPPAPASMPAAAPAPAAGYYQYPYYNYYPQGAQFPAASTSAVPTSASYPYSYYGTASQATPAGESVAEKRVRLEEADAFEMIRLQNEEDTRRHNEDVFEENLRTLAEYKAAYGDCNVPVVRSSELKTHSHVSPNGERIDMVKYYYLGLWLKDVKIQFKIFDLKPTASSLTRDQMKRLRDIGFGPGGDVSRKKVDTSLPITVKRFPSLASDKPEKNSKRALWDEDKFISLQQFVQAMGHADVPQNTESKASSPISRLRRWLNDIQEAYLKIENSEAALKSSSDNDDEALTYEQVERLKAAGFDLQERAEAYRLYRKTVIPPSFEDKVMAWLHYRSSNGGMDPPPPSKGEKGHPVGTWISLVRRKYKQLQQKEGNEPPKRKSNRGAFVLTKDRVDKLDELGFMWEEQKSSKQLDFESRVQELLEFERTYGHLNVPQNEKGLGTWVKTQRSQYRKFFRGETTFITQERIDRLNEIGFDFEPKVRGNRKSRGGGSKKSKKRKNALPMHKKAATRAAPGKRRKMQQQEEPNDVGLEDDEPLFSSSSDEGEDDDDNSVGSVASEEGFPYGGNGNHEVEDAEDEQVEEEEGPLVLGEEDEIDIDLDEGGALVVV